jgi:hypothetical protein
MNSITPAKVTQPEWVFCMAAPFLGVRLDLPAHGSDTASPCAGDFGSPLAR